jgi:hypothetical protein
MDSAKAIPAIWVYTTGSAFNAPGSDYGAWLTPAQQSRLERIRMARMLFDGKHREYFVDEGRTQFQFPEVRVGTQTTKMYLAYNVLGLISLKSADLLFGDEPILRSDVPEQQAALDDLSERCSLYTLLYNCAVDASYEAETIVEAVVKDGEVYLRQVPTDEVFPVGDLGPDLQYSRYDRYSVTNVGGLGGSSMAADKPIWLILKESYTPGSIERHCYQLNDDNKTLREIALDQWPVPANRDGTPGDAPDPLTETGIDQNTLVWVPNLLVRGKPVSDYDGLIDLQDMVNAKNTQIARVLLKHSDPKMVFPEESFDENGNIRSDFEAFPFSDPEKIPKYITWNAELALAVEDRKFALAQLLVRAETSGVLLGMDEGAAPVSYATLRLRATNSLTKARRKAAYWKQGIRRLVGVAQALEQTLPGTRYDVSDKPLGVEPRDGIPVDELDQATTLSTLRGCKLMSIEGGLEKLYGDPATVAKELARIQTETAQETPTVFGGDGGGASESGEGGEVYGGGPEDASQADANRSAELANPDSVAGAANSYTNSGVSAGSAMRAMAAALGLALFIIHHSSFIISAAAGGVA